MNVIRPNIYEYERENQELSRKEREDNERAEYIQRLRKSRKFQKYIVQEIFQNQLDETFSLDRIPLTDEMNKLGEVTLQYILARKAIEKIIDKIK